MLLSLLLQQPPDTTDGLIIGYVVMGGIGLLYLASLFIRWRNHQRDIEVINKLRDGDE